MKIVKNMEAKTGMHALTFSSPGRRASGGDTGCQGNLVFHQQAKQTHNCASFHNCASREWFKDLRPALLLIGRTAFNFGSVMCDAHHCEIFQAHLDLDANITIDRRSPGVTTWP